MAQNIIVVGANHAGTAALNTILDSGKDINVTAFDANSNISFLGCGMALWIGGQISGPEGLFYSSRQALEAKGAHVHMNTKVSSIDFERKTIRAKCTTGDYYEQAFDKLILATGSMPVSLPIKGIDLHNVQFVKLYQNAEDVIHKLKNKNLKKITIIGAGYIGVELAEAFCRCGREVTLIDSASACLSSYYDEPFSRKMEENLERHGIRLAFRETVQRLEGHETIQQVITEKASYDTDMAVFCAGFRPSTKLGDGVLEKFDNGAYLVSRRQETSIPDVYAAGDCATVYNNASQRTDYIALASNAVRSGIIAAQNALGVPVDSPGVQGSNGISIWNLKMVSTGLSLKKAIRLGYDAACVDYEDYQKAGFLETDNQKVMVHIIYDKSSRRILGAQLCSEYDISMAIHMFSLAVQEQVSIDTLKLFDMFFLPHFNQPYNYITMAALQAETRP